LRSFIIFFFFFFFFFWGNYGTANTMKRITNEYKFGDLEVVHSLEGWWKDVCLRYKRFVLFGIFICRIKDLAEICVLVGTCLLGNV